ncbi:MAG: class I SAM-dependent methyltransferase [Candidatus Omnitrophica bacterium]|nr:class I SAM-dependent methyltransferase [Candidatus Omnitrophota bacterium]
MFNELSFALSPATRFPIIRSKKTGDTRSIVGNETELGHLKSAESFQDDVAFMYLFQLMEEALTCFDDDEINADCLQQIIKKHYGNSADDLLKRYHWKKIYKEADVFYIPFEGENGEILLSYYFTETEPETTRGIECVEVEKGKRWFVCEPAWEQEEKRDEGREAGGEEPESTLEQQHEWQDLGQLLEPYLQGPATGKIIDASGAFPEDYIPHSHSSKTCNKDKSAKFKRDSNINWACEVASQKKTLVVICAGSTDYNILQEVQGIERIILVDLNERLLKDTWMRMPDKLKTKTYLVCANCTWIKPEAVRTIKAAIESAATFKEAKEKVLAFVSDSEFWMADPRLSFPDGYADCVIMEKAYTQIPIVFRNYVAYLMKDRFRHNTKTKLLWSPEGYGLELMNVVQKGLNRITIDEMRRITNPNGGVIYVGAMEYYPRGKFDPMERIIDENDYIYELSKDASDVSAYLPHQKWLDVENSYFGQFYGLRGYCYKRGGNTYPLREIIIKNGKGQNAISNIARQDIVFGQLVKDDSLYPDTHILSSEEKKITGRNLECINSMSHWFYTTDFLDEIFRILIDACDPLIELNANGLVVSRFDENALFFKSVGRKHGYEKLRKRLRSAKPIIVVQEKLHHFDSEDENERTEILFQQISRIGYLIRHSFKLRRSPTGHDSYEYATYEGKIDGDSELASALENFILNATIRSRFRYESIDDFKNALIEFRRKHLFGERGGQIKEDERKREKEAEPPSAGGDVDAFRSALQGIKPSLPGQSAPNENVEEDRHTGPDKPIPAHIPFSDFSDWLISKVWGVFTWLGVHVFEYGASEGNGEVDVEQMPVIDDILNTKGVLYYPASGRDFSTIRRLVKSLPNITDFVFVDPVYSKEWKGYHRSYQKVLILKRYLWFWGASVSDPQVEGELQPGKGGKVKVVIEYKGRKANLHFYAEDARIFTPPELKEGASIVVVKNPDESLVWDSGYWRSHLIANNLANDGLLAIWCVPIMHKSSELSEMGLQRVKGYSSIFSLDFLRRQLGVFGGFSWYKKIQNVKPTKIADVFVKREGVPPAGKGLISAHIPFSEVPLEWLFGAIAFIGGILFPWAGYGDEGDGDSAAQSPERVKVDVGFIENLEEIIINSPDLPRVITAREALKDILNTSNYHPEIYGAAFQSLGMIVYNRPERFDSDLLSALEYRVKNMDLDEIMYTVNAITYAFTSIAHYRRDLIGESSLQLVKNLIMQEHKHSDVFSWLATIFVRFIEHVPDMREKTFTVFEEGLNKPVIPRQARHYIGFMLAFIIKEKIGSTQSTTRAEKILRDFLTTPGDPMNEVPYVDVLTALMPYGLLTETTFELFKDIFLTKDLLHRQYFRAGVMLEVIAYGQSEWSAKATDILSAILFKTPGLSFDVYSSAAIALGHLVDYDIIGLDEIAQMIVDGKELSGEMQSLICADILEKLLFRNPGTFTLEQIDKIFSRFDPRGNLKYFLFYLSTRPDVSKESRDRARQILDDSNSFLMHRSVEQALGKGTKKVKKVLIVHNIADGQGDELIRNATFMQALIDYNPELEVTIVTNRPYLYDHPRIMVMPIKEKKELERLLKDRFDVVINHFDPDENYDTGFNTLVEERIKTESNPFIYVNTDKSSDRFIFQVVSVDGQDMTEMLKLNKGRHGIMDFADNVYEPTFRLLAELGIPFRSGEEEPARGSIFVSGNFKNEDAEWNRIMRSLDNLDENGSEKRDVTVLMPFGGESIVKGFHFLTEEKINELKKVITEEVANGNDVLILPNGECWGTEEIGKIFKSFLPDTVKRHVAVGPEPQKGPRLFKYFVSKSKKVMAVEGGMIHLVYNMGKLFELMKVPGSGLTKWIPFGINSNQSKVLYFLKGEYREDGRPLAFGDLVDEMGTIEDVFAGSEAEGTDDKEPPHSVGAVEYRDGADGDLGPVPEPDSGVSPEAVSDQKQPVPGQGVESGTSLEDQANSNGKEGREIEGFPQTEKGISIEADILQNRIQMFTPEIQKRIKKGKILLLGPGRHISEILMLIEALPEMEALTVVDNSSEKLLAINEILNARSDIDRDKIEFFCADFSDLPFDSGEFDFCFSKLVITSTDKATPAVISGWISEIRRVVKDSVGFMRLANRGVLKESGLTVVGERPDCVIASRASAFALREAGGAQPNNTTGMGVGATAKVVFDAEGLLTAAGAEEGHFRVTKAKEKRIIAIHTGWIPEGQFVRAGLMKLLQALSGIPKYFGFNHIAIVYSRDKAGLEKSIQQEIDQAVDSGMTIPESNITIIGRDDVVEALRKTYKKARFAKMYLTGFDKVPNGDIRLLKILTTILSHGPDEEIVVDEYLTIRPDPNNPNSYLINLTAEPIDLDADKNKYFLEAKEIDTRA